MHIPENWIIVTNHSRNHYSKEIPVLSHPSSYKITVSDINSNGSHDTRLFELNRGFLTDEELSILFYASDATILPYTVTSASGVMFDALTHGLPFIATDLGFFKEFANKGLRWDRRNYRWNIFTQKVQMVNYRTWDTSSNLCRHSNVFPCCNSYNYNYIHRYCVSN